MVSDAVKEQSFRRLCSSVACESNMIVGDGIGDSLYRIRRSVTITVIVAKGMIRICSYKLIDFTLCQIDPREGIRTRLSITTTIWQMNEIATGLLSRRRHIHFLPSKRIGWRRRFTQQPILLAWIATHYIEPIIHRIVAIMIEIIHIKFPID